MWVSIGSFPANSFRLILSKRISFSIETEDSFDGSRLNTGESFKEDLYPSPSQQCCSPIMLTFAIILNSYFEFEKDLVVTRTGGRIQL